MAVKKSELYSSLWASCDELRGGMDASEYKDYVLLMLFIKYISDKYAGVPFAAITVPEGASFTDMVALKGNPDIGDLINKKIIAPIEQANTSLGSIKVDFDNPEKLGTGKEKVDRLTKLIGIFEGLNFSSNKAEGDDLLGDAYEYLMRNFATESGKSKGQFYTPAEVSRIMAKIIGINKVHTTADTTIYDPTCGSGSLLLKVADEADKKITIYGQEKESATAGLARMNMVLHDCPTALIRCTGNSTLSDPQFMRNGELEQFDFVVANPPFSLKSWSNGVFDADGGADAQLFQDGKDFGRFNGFGIPPEKNGDYAFLLHIIRSLKSTGKAAVILPHGVLFRGNAEADIRRNLIQKGYIKGIIGLPANLFYGTGIPASLIVIDKEYAESRTAIFMIDASKDFTKDGPKNRLRDQDIHKIVDVFNKQLELPKYSRIVPRAEIEAKDYNLNIPRYIDSQEEEDIQDIEAHLNGGIPNTDIDALQAYWDVYPLLKISLFDQHDRPGYSQLAIEKSAIKATIFGHPEFVAYSKQVLDVFGQWKQQATQALKGIDVGVHPKQLIHELSESLLTAFSNLRLIDKYDVYQHLMSYWSETMQDDVFVIASDGWKTGREVYRIMKSTKDKNGTNKPKTVDGMDGIESKLLKPALIINRYFAAEKAAIDALEAQRDAIGLQLEELEEEHSGDDGLLVEARNDKDKITAASVKDRLKRIKGSKADAEERAVLETYLKLSESQSDLGKQLKEEQRTLETKVWNQYKALTDDEIKTLVVDDKWMQVLDDAIHTEMQRISQRLTRRITELADRYDMPLPDQIDELNELERRVNAHLLNMGFKLDLSKNQQFLRQSYPTQQEGSIENQILSYLRNSDDLVFFVESFSSLGNANSVSRALARLAESEELYRIATGIYVRPMQDETIGLVLPDIDEIATAIAKRDKARIMPTGSYALYKLGLTTQVPMNIVYYTDGSARSIEVGRQTITFKKASAKNVAAIGSISKLAIQALRDIGTDNVTEEELHKIRELLKNERPLHLAHDLELAPEWIRRLLDPATKKHANA